MDAGTLLPAAGEAGHQSLAAANRSFDGCNLILNNEHWVTRRYVVDNHTAATVTFDYDVSWAGEECQNSPCDSSLCEEYADDGRARYFVDGCEAALDTPGERAHDGEGRTLLRLPATIGSMSEAEIAGKNQTYSLACISCANLTVRGLNFFATTAFIFDSPGASVEQCSFSYPSASRRSLGGAPHRIEGAG